MTPIEWAAHLERKLRAGRREIDMFSMWYDGRQPVPPSSRECSDAYRRLLEMGRTNWAALVVDAAADRLFVDGFRFSDDGDAGVSGDTAWGVWQASGMDAESSDAILEALVSGRCPLMVTRRGDGGSALITVEDPREVVLEVGPRGERLAALKMFRDAERYRTVELMLPGALYRWRSDAPDPPDMSDDRDLWVSRFGEPDVLAGDVEVPVFELRANRRVGRRSEGRSELAGRLDSLRRIDKLSVDALVVAEFGAFRQKWATGMELPDEGEAPFRAAIDKLFVSEDSETKFGDFAATDLTGYLSAIERAVTHLAAVTKTPPHYLLSGMTNLSADAIRAAEASLVMRVRRHQRAFGEPIEAAVRHALRIEGHVGLAADIRAETVWAKPETRTTAELADGLAKLVAGIGMPREAAWAEFGASPQQVAEWRAMSVRERLFDAPVAA